MKTQYPSEQDITIAERLIFDRTDFFIGQSIQDGQTAFRLAAIDHPFLQLYRGLGEKYGNGVDSPTVLPALADFYRRKIIDPDGDEIAANVLSRARGVTHDLNAIGNKIEDPIIAEATLLNIVFNGLNAVYFRPEGLAAPKLDRKMQKSDLGELREHHYANLFRQRANFFYEISLGTIVTKQQRILIQSFIASNGRLDLDAIHDRLSARNEQLPSGVIKILTKLMLSAHAKAMLPLFRLNDADAEDVKKSFIDRSFVFIESESQFGTADQHFLNIEVTNGVKKHILKGDNRGGAHHMPSLDPQYSKITGDVEYVEESYNGRSIAIPVARQIRYDSSGNVRDDRVSTFFPNEWTAEEVISAIQNPTRLAYLREEDDGRIIDYVQSNGMLIKRVYIIEADGKRELITAHPAASIPPAMEKRLSSAVTVA